MSLLRGLSDRNQRGIPLLKTGQLATRAGILPSKVRFYVNEGLLEPAALTAGGYYLFNEEEALERIDRIRDLQVQERRTLTEIKDTLAR